MRHFKAALSCVGSSRTLRLTSGAVVLRTRAELELKLLHFKCDCSILMLVEKKRIQISDFHQPCTNVVILHII